MGGLFAQSYFSGDLFHYRWNFGGENLGACWKHCLTKAIEHLAPTAILINQGLHLLHNYPVRPCAGTSTARNAYFDCGRPYADFVASLLRELHPEAGHVVWKTTNAGCKAKCFDEWDETISRCGTAVRRGGH